MAGAPTRAVGGGEGEASGSGGLESGTGQSQR